ncbi:uncharacterized protein JCM6883_004342 [Sporobolomyces salmoneus]|uniref:uncharacterized protein n=1 Tax=Sporobolomyces salmoneus TaxID=183962 RepID=UPI00317F944A
MDREQIVRPLPERTTSLLRSSIILPSFPSIVSELVFNSLDAQATSIHVTIDLSTWSTHCKDNGTGISGAELGELDRYSTNKSVERDYGFRGEALQSMQDLGLLHIVSRQAGANETFELVKRNGETLEFAQARANRNEPGTTVSVRDIFYKYPVRRKSLSALSAQLSTISQVRSQLSIISLAHPNVSFHLTDTSTNEVKSLLSVSRSVQGVLGRWRQLWGRAGIEQVWEVDKVDEETGMRVKGFVSESASHGKSNQFIFVNGLPLSSSSSTLHKSVNQLFSTSSFSRHSSSLLTLPVSSPSNSRSSSPVQTRQQSRNTPKKNVEKHPIFLFELELDRGTQVTARYGMGEFDSKYIEFRDEDRVVAFLQSIVKEFLVEKGFSSIATKKRGRTEGFGNNEEQSCTEQARGDTGRIEPVEPENRRTPSSLFEPPAKKVRRTINRPSEPSRSRRQVPFARTASVSPALDLPSLSSNLVDPSTGPLRWTDPVSGQTFEIDPRTGNSWRLDPIRAEEPESDEVPGRTNEGEKLGGRTGMVDRRGLKRKSRVSLVTGGSKAEETRNDREEDGDGSMPEWLRNTLAKWENPIFPASKPVSATRIPSLESTVPPTSSHNLFSSSKSSLAATTSKPSRSKSTSSAQITQSRLSQISKFFSSSTPSTTSVPSIYNATSNFDGDGGGGLGNRSFSRESLKKAEFIAQIDDKYLVVKLPSTSTGAAADEDEKGLVMFDQHAVSERIRVERFLQEICGGNEVERLSLVDGVTEYVGKGKKDQNHQGIGVILSKEEFRQLNSSKPDFGQWGFTFSDSSSSSASSTSIEDYVQVWVESVPNLVGQRLKQDSKLLQELIRGYLAQLQDQPARHHSRLGEGEGGGGEVGEWVKRGKDCPVGLVELINSKACRGAIMFADHLRDDQAQKLLRDLAETKFPFTCAHGRPSIVPLVNLASSQPSAVEDRAKIDWNLLK